jgi:hypothetical protein
MCGNIRINLRQKIVKLTRLKCCKVMSVRMFNYSHGKLASQKEEIKFLRSAAGFIFQHNKINT